MKLTLRDEIGTNTVNEPKEKLGILDSRQAHEQQLQWLPFPLLSAEDDSIITAPIGSVHS